MLLLQEFELEVIHQPRGQHAIADYLSRLDTSELPIGIADEFPDASLFAALTMSDSEETVQNDVVRAMIMV